MRLKVEKFSERISPILEKSVFGFMDVTTAQGRERPVPGWEQFAPISRCDFVGGLLALVAVMKRKVAAPVRPPAPDWEQLEETQKFPETCWTGLGTGTGGKDSNEAMAFAAKVQGFKWRPNGGGFAL